MSTESVIGKVLTTLRRLKEKFEKAVQSFVTIIQNQWNNVAGNGIQLNDDEDFSEGIHSLNIKEFRYRNKTTIDVESKSISSNQNNTEFITIQEQFNALIFQTEPQNHATAMNDSSLDHSHHDTLYEFTDIKFSNDENQQQQTSSSKSAYSPTNNDDKVIEIQTTIQSTEEDQLQTLQAPSTARLSFFQQQKLLEQETSRKKAEEYSKMNETQKAEYHKSIQDAQDHESLKIEHYGRMGNIYVSRPGLLEVRSSRRSSHHSRKSDIISNSIPNNNDNSNTENTETLMV